ncbi:hypothetical protein B6175_00200 [Staphylococcus aureus]|nr:hypothetical protein B6175_00200 [Staphylococcus aureus]
MCSARLSAVPTKTIKPLRPFFKKTCPLPPQQRGVLLSCSFKNQQGTGSISVSYTHLTLPTTEKIYTLSVVGSVRCV